MFDAALVALGLLMCSAIYGLMGYLGGMAAMNSMKISVLAFTVSTGAITAGALISLVWK